MTTPVTLKESDVAQFDELASTFSRLLDDALNERTYKVSASVSQHLSEMSIHLGRLNCGPRDVVEILRACLKDRLQTLSPIRAAQVSEVGHLMAFELMGYLVNFYRRAVLETR